MAVIEPSAHDCADAGAGEYGLQRRLVAECLGTAFLLAAIVGSGIQASHLFADSAGLALLCNTVATGAMLVVLITLLGPVSGAHFNPAVTLAFLLRGEIARGQAALYVLAQLSGGIAGTVVAHAMFGQPLWQLSSQVRGGAPLLISEGIAAFGLVAAILLAIRHRPQFVPWIVGLYITAAYWFTASTSFANPAVTLARALTDTFAGIRPLDAPAFIAAQFAGAVVACAAFHWFAQSPRSADS